MSKLIVTLEHDFKAGKLYGYNEEQCCIDPSHYFKGDELRKFAVGWDKKDFRIRADLLKETGKEFEMWFELKYKSAKGGYYEVVVNEEEGTIDFRVKASFVTNKLYPEAVNRLQELKGKVDLRLAGIMYKAGARGFGMNSGYDGSIIGQNQGDLTSWHRITEWKLVD